MRRRVLAAIGAGLLGLMSLTACSGGGPSGGATPATFTNPIVQTGQDPWVIRSGDHYLLAQSHDDAIWLTTSAAKDLTGIGDAVPEKIWQAPASGDHCSDLWAPELHQAAGHWFVYYAANGCDHENADHRMFVLESKGADPAGPYVDRGAVQGMPDRWAIDGTRVTFEGATYFVWSGWPGTTDGRQNLSIARMASPTAVEGAPVLLSQPTAAFEQHGSPIEEGPEALQHDGRLMLVYSASGSWTDDYAYGLLTLTGTDPLRPGDWTKTPHAVFAKTADVWGPGHGSFTTSPDGTEQWMVYHSARFKGSGWDRVIDAQRFTFAKDGSPVFGRPVSPDAPQAVPSGQRG